MQKRTPRGAARAISQSNQLKVIREPNLNGPARHPNHQRPCLEESGRVDCRILATFFALVAGRLRFSGYTLEMDAFLTFAGYAPRTSTVLATHYDRWCLVCHPSRGRIRDEEWKAFNAHIERRLCRGEVSFIVFSARPGLSAAQRAMSTAIFEQAQGDVRVSVLSASKAVRYAATAWAWVSGHSLSMFRPDDIDGALTHALVPESYAPTLRCLLARMMATQGLKPVPTWAAEAEGLTVIQPTSANIAL